MARYTPGNIPTDSAEIVDFLRLELAKIAQAMDTADQFLALETLYAAPKKYRGGTLVKADGTNWNPGSGQGIYCFYGAAWHFLG